MGLVRTFVSLVLVGLAAGDPSAYCSEHGSLQCACPKGYTGPRCETPVDWCAEARAAFDASLGAGSVCGHGHCVSEPAKGAHCVCLHGYQGPNCDVPVPGQRLDTRRCYLNPAASTAAPPKDVQPCNATSKCVLDDYNCYQPSAGCSYPLGWCLPAHRVASFLVQLQPGAQSGAFLLAASSGCAHGGVASCVCAAGYTGPTCAQPIDFCASKHSSDVATEGAALGGVCGGHGTCRSTTAGVVCDCEAGWAGLFCERNDPAKVRLSKRCALYSTEELVKRNLTTGGCEGTERCLSDRLNCGFQKCALPLGWCSPLPVGLHPEY